VSILDLSSAGRSTAQNDIELYKSTISELKFFWRFELRPALPPRSAKEANGGTRRDCKSTEIPLRMQLARAAYANNGEAQSSSPPPMYYPSRMKAGYVKSPARTSAVLTSVINK
jgi:hypothetical protein